MAFPFECVDNLAISYNVVDYGANLMTFQIQLFASNIGSYISELSMASIELD